MVPRSTAVTIGNASGMVDPVRADGQLADSGIQVGLETTNDESAVIPFIEGSDVIDIPVNVGICRTVVVGAAVS